MRTTRMTVLLGLALLACSGGSGGGGGGSEAPAPVTQGKVEAASGLEVTATIAAVTLGDDCGGSAGDFAPSESGRCAPGASCGSTCQASNLQLAFVAGAGSAGARVEIVSVTLHDQAGESLATLTASGPRVWSDNAYTAWDQTVPPGKETKASYELSSPPWSAIGQGGTSTYSAKYTARVVLRIDGQMLTLQSATLSREPQVAT